MSVVARVRLYWSVLVRADKKDFQIRSAVTSYARRGIASSLLFVAVAFLSANFSPELRCQTATGSIAGRVKDPSGAAVSGATVRLTNVTIRCWPTMLLARRTFKIAGHASRRCFRT